MDNNNTNQTQNNELNFNNVQPVQQPIENTVINEEGTNLEYNEVLKPGEELDDFHHEKQIEAIDVKFLGTNKLAVFSFVLSFILPVIPFILAIISIRQIRKTHEGGKIFAIIAMIINFLLILISLVILIYVMRIGPFENKMKNVTDDQMRICKNLVYGCDNDEDENGFKTCSYCQDSDTECNDIRTIECPTDELIEKTNKDNYQRAIFGLKN